jgi:hypothetical protein
MLQGGLEMLMNFSRLLLALAVQEMKENKAMKEEGLSNLLKRVAFLPCHIQYRSDPSVTTLQPTYTTSTMTFRTARHNRRLLQLYKQ